ncbi:hypothetical protein C8F04DRAFT_1303074 [Mycena alexandri]|uniref:Uncharacterized protein n=1 Tax=Mycena alexandri TaxID=1745969 RepID=A0AAD6WSW8_9AGAR|nr:hypothetical protein C8F04DRAFT_1303074 [Mycena alexandri]
MQCTPASSEIPLNSCTSASSFVFFFRRPTAPPTDAPNTPTSVNVDMTTPSYLDVAGTTYNTLKLALKTLSSVTSNIPLGSVLSAAIDPLLEIVDRIEQTSANVQGFVELAARIELLTPIVSEMAGNPQGVKLVEALQRELQSITKDLEVASSRGKLDQFLNSPVDALCLQKHNTALAQLIADSTLVTVTEVLHSIHKLKHSESTSGRRWEGVDIQAVELAHTDPSMQTKSLELQTLGIMAPVSFPLPGTVGCRVICSLLERDGFETAEAVDRESDRTLKKAGLKAGELAELRRALREWQERV